MTMVTGGSSSVSPSAPSVVRVVRCSGRVPQRTAATGVSARRPPAISRAATSARWATPMSTTIVPPGGGQRLPVGLRVDRVAAVAGDHGERRRQAPVGDRDRRRRRGRRPPTSPRARPRTRRPRRSRASASSPPRPNTNGSPPLSRTTAAPARPCSTSRALISSWCTGPPGRLPTSMRSAPAGARSSSDASARRS